MRWHSAKLIKPVAAGVFTVLLAVALPISVLSASFDELTLTLTTDTPERLPFEPIEVTITLSNQTDHEVYGHTMLYAGYEYLRFMVSMEREDFKQFNSANVFHKSIEKPEPSLFKPGKSIQVMEKLSYGWTDNDEKEGIYLFEKPGVYSIKVVLDNLDRKNKIESNILKITVKDAKGVDAEALKLV